MHIPDGYLAPAFSLGMGVLTVPSWVIASRRVRQELSQRMVPAMAVFAAFTFTVMMFNVPVPGGTTAHGVGGTLVAIVLGPAAAVIVVSTALIIQALFFGDGGVLAIFANCFNMAVLLPLSGYATYRLIGGSAPLFSRRRIWAAGIGGYVGITVAAVAVAVELGVQPTLFNADGVPLYSPYGLAVTLPAMLVAHLFGAAIVEGVITGLGFGYLQQRHPEYLGAAALPGPAGGVRPTWQVMGAGLLVLVGLLLLGGWLTGGGDLTQAYGTDWTAVDWSAVGVMAVMVLVLAAVLLPLAWVLLPRSIRTIGTVYLAAAIVAPIGLIAPGFAYGEGSAEDVHAELGYVPQGLQDMSSFFSAPFKDYNVPLPFFSDADAPLWRVALGYEITGLLGMLLLGALLLGLTTLLTHRGPDPRQPTTTPA